MPRLKLTKTLISSITFNEKGKQDFYWDSQLTGFGLCVGKKSKVFIVQDRIKGKTRRIRIGKHGVYTLEQARKEAKTILLSMSKDKDPIDLRKEEKAKDKTLSEVFDEFLRARKNLKDRTIRDYKYTFSHYFQDWTDKPFIDITKDMVSKRHEKLGLNSHARANLAMRVLRTVLNFAIAQYEDSQGKPIMSENPVTRLSQTRAWYRVDRRRTVIKSHQLAAFFKGINSLTGQGDSAETVRDYILFLLLTGLRPKAEGVKLRWINVDFKAKTFHIPDTKNKEPHTLPMSDYLLNMLKRRHEKRVNDFVFSGSGVKGHMVEPHRQIQKIIGVSGVQFTLYDLRRTFITTGESLDLSYYAVKRLLNHKISGDVTAGYIIADVERLRKPMQRITDYILKAAGIKEKAEVVKLRRRDM